MKNLKLIVASLMLLLTMQASAQSWYTPNTTYTFRSINAAGTGVNIVTLYYDAYGTVTVGTSTGSITTGDTRRSMIFGPSADYSISSDNTEITINQNNSSWHTITLDNGNLDETGTVVGGKVTITCGCKISMDNAPVSGTCNVSYTYSNGCICTTCVPDANCLDCSDPKVGAANPADKSILLFKADAFVAD